MRSVIIFAATTFITTCALAQQPEQPDKFHFSFLFGYSSSQAKNDIEEYLKVNDFEVYESSSYSGSRQGFGTTIRFEYLISPRYALTAAVSTLGWLIGNSARVRGSHYGNSYSENYSYAAEHKSLGYYGGLSFLVTPTTRSKSGAHFQIGLALGTEKVKFDREVFGNKRVIRIDNHSSMGVLGHMNYEWRFGYAMAVGFTFEYRYIPKITIDEGTFDLGTRMDYSTNPPRQVQLSVTMPSHEVEFSNWNLGFLIGVYF